MEIPLRLKADQIRSFSSTIAKLRNHYHEIRQFLPRMMENQLYFRQNYMLQRQRESFLVRISSYQLSERDGLPRLYEDFREANSGDVSACLSTF